MTKTAMIFILTCCANIQLFAHNVPSILDLSSSRNSMVDSVVKYTDEFPHMSTARLMLSHSLTKLEYEYDARKNPLKVVLFIKSHLADATWEKRQKVDRTFDANNNMLTENVSFWDEATNKWTLTEKCAQEFDQRSNMLSTSAYSWDADTKAWVGKNRIVNVYNDRNHLLSKVYYNDMLDGKWVLSGKKTYKYEYGDTDYVQHEEAYFWVNGGENTWELYSKKKYVYDYQNNIKETYYAKDLVNYSQKKVYTSINGHKSEDADWGYQSYHWDGAVWVLGTTLDIRYTALGQVLQKTFIEFDEVSKQYMKRTEENYTYDAFGNLVNYTMREGNKNNEWQNHKLMKYVFDSKNNLTSEATHYWDASREVWKVPTYWKYDNDYSNNKLVECRAFRGEEGIWEPYSKRRAAYDAYNNVTMTEFYWRNGHELVLSERVLYYYNTSNSSANPK